MIAKQVIRTCSVALLVAIAQFGVSPNAVADTIDRPGPEDQVAAKTLQALRSTSKTQLRTAAKATPNKRASKTIDISTVNARTTVPQDPADMIRIDSRSTMKGIGIRLPFSDVASEAKTVSEGTVVYDNSNGTTTAPIVQSDGSVQINTVIFSPDSPRSFEYTLDLPPATVAEDIDGGMGFFVGSQFIGGISPAWATDAYGREVPTRYEFTEGRLLIQHINHSRDYAYPIVGDPWVSTNIFSSITLDSLYGQPRVNLNLSNLGWTYYWSAVGIPVIIRDGWVEAKGKSSAIRRALERPGMRDQFDCHAFGAALAGPWNLEAFRPGLWVPWQWGVATHHCNWKTRLGGL